MVHRWRQPVPELSMRVLDSRRPLQPRKPSPEEVHHRPELFFFRTTTGPNALRSGRAHAEYLGRQPVDEAVAPELVSEVSVSGEFPREHLPDGAGEHANGVGGGCAQAAELVQF